MLRAPKKSATIYLGIDPGKAGGLAALIGDRVILSKMPDTEKDVLDWFERVSIEPSPLTYAAIEKVWGHIGQNQPGSRMFNFGWGYGGLRMALLAYQIPFEEVTPRTWQKVLGIPSKKKVETKTHWKNRLKAVAQRLFPKEDVTLATADALLIAEFYRRKCEGRL